MDDLYEFMDEIDEKIILFYKQCLKRAAWRLQYKAKAQNYRESMPLLENSFTDIKFESEIISQLYVNELLSTIKSPKEKYIIDRIFIQGAIEKEVSKELKISQQGVNKWKRKALKNLRMKINIL